MTGASYVGAGMMLLRAGGGGACGVGVAGAVPGAVPGATSVVGGAVPGAIPGAGAAPA
ncbi:MAG: hypothetical protein PGN29_19410 [Gordonia paraffinivorans]